MQRRPLNNLNFFKVPQLLLDKAATHHASQPGLRLLRESSYMQPESGVRRLPVPAPL